MASKTKETFTVIVSMVLVALLSYSIIHVYRYYIHYGGLLEAPADVYLPFLYKVFPSFFVLFLATVILLATRSSDRQRPTASAAPADTEQNHTYSLDIFGADLEKRSETPAAQAEVPQESTLPVMNPTVKTSHPMSLISSMLLRSSLRMNRLLRKNRFRVLQRYTRTHSRVMLLRSGSRSTHQCSPLLKKLLRWRRMTSTHDSVKRSHSRMRRDMRSR